MEIIDDMDNIIEAIDMRMRKNKHERREHVLRAKQSDEKEVVMSEMRKKYDKEIKYNKWVYIKENIEKMRNEMDDVTPMQEVIQNMKIASDMLSSAIKKMNPEEVSDMMEELENNSLEIHELNKILSDTNRCGVPDFDEEEVLVELKKPIVVVVNKKIPVCI